MAMDRTALIDQLVHIQHRVHVEMSEALTDMHQHAEQRRDLRHVYENEAAHIEELMRTINAEIETLIEQLEASNAA